MALHKGVHYTQQFQLYVGFSYWVIALFSDFEPSWSSENFRFNFQKIR